MQASTRNRQFYELSSDLAALRASCARLVDTFVGLSLLFGVVSALVIAVGVWAREPLFTMSAGFAAAGSIALAFSAHALFKARESRPTLLAVPAQERPAHARQGAARSWPA